MATNTARSGQLDNDIAFDSIALDTNTSLSESSGDTLFENSSATNDMITKLGDSAGATNAKITDSSDNLLLGVESGSGTATIGKVGVASVVELDDAASVVQVKLNTVGDSYFTGGKLGIGTLTPNTLSDIQGGQTVNTTTVNAATYDLLITDYILNVTYTSTGAVTSLTLPTAQTVDGRVIVIKDAGGNATTNSITVDTEGGELIDGAATLVINANYNSVNLYCDGTNWFIF